MSQELPPHAVPAPPPSEPRGPRACSICQRKVEPAGRSLVRGLRPALLEFLRARHPGDWGPTTVVCNACLSRERLDFLMEHMATERGQLSEVEAEIARKATRHQALAEDIEARLDAGATRGQRIADRVASTGGSWAFVLTFLLALGLWIGINSFGHERFDPYPYILLNLLLSCLAALQAPVIMMSQNRQSNRDRLQADQDFRVNLKAELEIASLHEKVDHVLHAQYEHMVELQEVQLDLLNELAAARRR